MTLGFLIWLSSTQFPRTHPPPPDLPRLYLKEAAIELNCADFCSFRGVYFIMVMRLDFNVSDPARNLRDLKAIIQNTCWYYLRTIVHFQLHQEVLLNSTAFSFGVRKRNNVSISVGITSNLIKYE